MTDRFDRILSKAPSLRRFAWRAGRRLYSAARGEPRINAIGVNGEAYVQRRVAAALACKASPIVFDVGANEGEWTLSLLDALDSAGVAEAEIHAFEPVPETRRRLHAQLDARPHRQRVVIRELALSNAAGWARIAIMSESGGTNSLHPDGGAQDPPGGFFDVATQDLDGYCSDQGLARVNLVKFDLEGHDAIALSGARRMLGEERIDVLQFEYNHRWVFSRSYLKDAFDLVADLPYSLARVRPDCIELIPRWHPELERFFEANYLLVRHAALDWFARRHGSFDASNAYA
jgi:FkbM family methyltransferase